MRPPVLNALANGLVEATESDTDRAALLADVLWSLETREARLVALVLLRRQPPSDLVFRVLAWSETSEDPQVLAELAGVALAPVRAQQPEAFLQSLAGLRRDYKHRRRAFALRALQAAVEDRSFHSIPRILELLPPGPEEPVGEERRALNDLGVALARRTPGETSRWLREALDRRQAWAYPVALAAVEVLPERSRPSLELSLMGAGAAGIMTARND